MYNEKEAILETQLGKTQAFGLIYDKHVKTIYNFIYYKVFDKESAEDLTSQTFFKALKNMSSVDADRPIISWLYKIAHNSILDHYRAQRHNEDIDDYWDIHDEDVDVVGKLDTEVDAKRVKKYLKELGSTERDIIFMRVWQEMPYSEIAEIIGKSEANCKMIYSRAMKKLKTLIPLLLFILYY
jgi:RNA polymerase sigma-70 factor, ECF subfamily